MPRCTIPARFTPCSGCPSHQTLIHKHALELATTHAELHARAEAAAHAAADVIARALPDPFWWRHRKSIALYGRVGKKALRWAMKRRKTAKKKLARKNRALVAGKTAASVSFVARTAHGYFQRMPGQHVSVVRLWLLHWKAPNSKLPSGRVMLGACLKRAPRLPARASWLKCACSHLTPARNDGWKRWLGFKTESFELLDRPSELFYTWPRDRRCQLYWE